MMKLFVGLVSPSCLPSGSRRASVGRLGMNHQLLHGSAREQRQPTSTARGEEEVLVEGRLLPVLLLLLRLGGGT